MSETTTQPITPTFTPDAPPAKFTMPDLDVFQFEGETNQNGFELHTDEPQIETKIESKEKTIPGEEKKQTEYVPKSTTIEIDGKQYQVNEDMLTKFYGIDTNGVPLTDREFKSLVSAYKIHTHSTNTNRQAIQTQKQAEEAFKMIMENPEQALKQLFQNNPSKLREFSENYLLEIINDESLPEEQKIIRKQQTELEQYKKMIQEQERIKQESEFNQLKDNYQKDIESKIIAELQNTKLPKTSGTIQRMAHYMLKGLERGMDIQPKDVIPLVIEDYQNEFKSMFGESDPETLAKFIGDDKLKTIRQYDLSRVKGTNSIKKSDNFEPIPDKPQKNYLTEKEFRELTQKRIANLR